MSCAGGTGAHAPRLQRPLPKAGAARPAPAGDSAARAQSGAARRGAPCRGAPAELCPPPGRARCCASTGPGPGSCRPPAARRSRRTCSCRACWGGSGLLVHGCGQVRFGSWWLRAALAGERRCTEHGRKGCAGGRRPRARPSHCQPAVALLVTMSVMLMDAGWLLASSRLSVTLLTDLDGLPCRTA